MSFIVGVENYDNAELNRLVYASDDAQKVHDQLAIVSNLDSNSRLFVADDTTGSKFTDDDLRRELILFSRQIKRDRNNLNIVIYLGGHGTLSPGKKLWYLPSNYDPVNQLHFVPFSEILEYFTDQVATTGVYGTKITFLVNICGAGNAESLANPALRSQNVDNELISVSQQIYRELEFGKLSLAIVPATPRDRNAFEDEALKSSRFAHYLLEGMKGRAAGADGVLTANSLFGYIEKGLKEELPKNTGFAGNVQLGVTRGLEGRASLELGTALFAAAENLGAMAAPLPPDVLDHVALMQDLASLQLAQVETRNTDLGPRAKLRKIKVDAIRRAVIDVGGSVTDGERQLLDATELKELGALSETAKTFSTLRQFRDSLKSNPGSKALLLVDDMSDSVEEVAVWKRILTNLVREFELLALDAAAPRDLAWVEVLQRFRKVDDLRRRSAGPSPLLVIYAGRSELRPLDASSISTCNRLEKSPECDVIPFGIRDLQVIQQVWGAPFTFFHDAPFGGHLLEDQPAQVSLLVAARELNGMTFGGPRGSSSLALATAFEEGAEDPATHPLVQKTRASFVDTLGSTGNDFVVGTPLWKPHGTLLWDIAANQFGAAPQLLFQAASGCLAKSDTDCGAAIKTLIGEQNPLDELQEASKHDLRSQSGEAANGYHKAKQVFTALPQLPDAYGTAAIGAEVSKLTGLIAKRLMGVQSKLGRHVTLVTLSIGDYRSPLIADLNNTADDIEAYREAFGKFFGGIESIEFEHIALPEDSSADAILQRLSTLRQVSKDRPADLIVFVYSGRGAEIGGRRFLVTSQAQPGETADQIGGSLAGGLQQQNVVWEPTTLVDLADIAEAMRDVWFFGIYDAQFAAPIRDGAMDSLLQKHVDSVRLLTSPAPATITAQSNTFLFAPRGSIPARQVHLWLEGKLVQSSRAPNACLAQIGEPLKGPASPLASAIISSFETFKQGTYRDWVKNVAQGSCFRKSDAIDGVLTAQGDLDVPFLASGDGADLVSYFQDGSARRELNISAAAAVANDVLETFPTELNRLSVGALMIALMQLSKQRNDLSGQTAMSADWSATAEKVLERDMDPLVPVSPEADAENAELEAMRVELISRFDMLNGEPDRARDTLLSASPDVLSRRKLPQRLAQIAGEALRRQPTEILGQANAKIAKLLGSPSRQAALTSLAAQIDAERRLRGEPYRIGVPTR
ncbi:hypothetical protein [Rhizobium sophoriradicis]|nr:hypothetical protein [Rhizobium sophoriradicis]